MLIWSRIGVFGYLFRIDDGVLAEALPDIDPFLAHDEVFQRIGEVRRLLRQSVGRQALSLLVLADILAARALVLHHLEMFDRKL